MILEYESDFGYLGLRIIPTDPGFHLEFTVPGYEEVENSYPYAPALLQQRWRYRTTQPSGSAKGLLTGFESRLHSAARLATPTSRACEAIAKLITVALVTGHDTLLIKRILMKQGTRYPHVYAKAFHAELMHALKQPRTMAIRECQQAVGRARGLH